DCVGLVNGDNTFASSCLAHSKPTHRKEACFGRSSLSRHFAHARDVLESRPRLLHGGIAPLHSPPRGSCTILEGALLLEG
ncbi:unnamed protein product, partial [Closterium sp. Naga37s-1]